MSDDWEGSSSEEEEHQPSPQQQQQSKTKPESTGQTTKSAPSQQVKKPPQAGKKWEGEDEDNADEPVSDWEESSEEEEEDVKPLAAAAVPSPPKKKATLKQKLAEKEAGAKANGKDAHADDDSDSDEEESSDEYDSDAVLDPREKARRDKEKEVKSDMKNAADLFGSAARGAPSSSSLDALLSLQPRTKEDFISLSDKLISLLLKSHQSKPLYPFFVEHHARALALSLKDVEVRKAASGLTTLANEKQKEQRERASGKKKVKPKNAMKPALGSAKVSSKLDTSVYDEALDDFGTNADDFM